MRIMSNYQTEFFPRRNVLNTLAIHNIKGARNVTESLLELKLTLVLLFPDTEGNLPKHQAALKGRPCFVAVEGLILLSRKHFEDSKSLQLLCSYLGEKHTSYT